MALAHITTTEFAPCLKTLWQQIERRNAQGGRSTVGLCVSGGPDSMALAHLMKKVEDERKAPPYDLRAFIIDHGARNDSAVEADVVSTRLKWMGIEAQILKMDWLLEDDPMEAANFESSARRKRYRLLARASVKAGVQHLLTGHHEDDQVETIMMRLLRSSNSPFSAFQGMAPTSTVPCCEDIFGARHGMITGSDGKEEPGIYRRGERKLKSPVRTAQHIRGTPEATGEVTIRKVGFSFPALRDIDKRIKISNEELTLHRPLLTFPKSRLLETCKKDGLDFVDDRTNHDPQLTTRNAVRFLRANYQLPRALDGQRILNLHRLSKEKFATLQKRAKTLLESSAIPLLDLRSGFMTARLPELPKVPDEQDYMAAGYLLNRLLQPVSPIPSDNQPSIANKELVLAVLGASRSETARNTTHMGVFMQNFSPPNSTLRFWKLSRQPLRPRDIVFLTMQFTPDKDDERWSEWLLWDNRYWIRIKCRNAEGIRSITIKPYTKSDLSSMAAVENSCAENSDRLRDFRHLKNFALKRAAPGSIKYTLPVLTDENGGILAFPTVSDVRWSNWIFGGGRVERLRNWEVRYKSINKELRDSSCFPTAAPAEPVGTSEPTIEIVRPTESMELNTEGYLLDRKGPEIHQRLPDS